MDLKHLRSCLFLGELDFSLGSARITIPSALDQASATKHRQLGRNNQL